jgi:hypothetical protein
VLHDRYPDLLPAWRQFSETRGLRRAVDWLCDNGLITEESAEQYREGLAPPPGGAGGGR